MPCRGRQRLPGVPCAWFTYIADKSGRRASQALFAAALGPVDMPRRLDALTRLCCCSDPAMAAADAANPLLERAHTLDAYNSEGTSPTSPFAFVPVRQNSGTLGLNGLKPVAVAADRAKSGLLGAAASVVSPPVNRPRRPPAASLPPPCPPLLPHPPTHPRSERPVQADRRPEGAEAPAQRRHQPRRAHQPPRRAQRPEVGGGRWVGAAPVLYTAVGVVALELGWGGCCWWELCAEA